MSPVEYRAEAGIAEITISVPPANCYSYPMMRALDEAILEARFDREVHVIVLTGAGEKFFCAGADISMLQGADPDFKYNFCLHANETLLRLEHTPKLVIAAIGGHCVGGGLEIALACDLRIARAGAGRCGLPEAKLGVLPGTGGTQRLIRLIGKAKALELMITAEVVDFAQAHALGLVHQVWEAADNTAFLAKIRDYARGFIPPTAPSRAIGLIKRACQSGEGLSLADGLALERELQQRLFTGEDATEGLAAYVDRRPPAFKGR